MCYCGFIFHLITHENPQRIVKLWIVTRKFSFLPPCNGKGGQCVPASGKSDILEERSPYAELRFSGALLKSEERCFILHYAGHGSFRFFPFIRFLPFRHTMARLSNAGLTLYYNLPVVFLLFLFGSNFQRHSLCKEQANLIFGGFIQNRN